MSDTSDSSTENDYLNNSDYDSESSSNDRMFCSHKKKNACSIDGKKYYKICEYDNILSFELISMSKLKWINHSKNDHINDCVYLWTYYIGHESIIKDIRIISKKFPDPEKTNLNIQIDQCENMFENKNSFMYVLYCLMEQKQIDSVMELLHKEITKKSESILRIISDKRTNKLSRIRTFMYILLKMASQTDTIFQKTYDIIHSVYQKTTNPKIVWFFLVANLMYGNYENVKTILCHKLFKENKTPKNDVHILSFAIFTKMHFMIRSNNDSFDKNASDLIKLIEHVNQQYNVSFAEFFFLIEKSQKNRIEVQSFIEKLHKISSRKKSTWILDYFMKNISPTTNMNLKLNVPNYHSFFTISVKKPKPIKYNENDYYIEKIKNSSWINGICLNFGSIMQNENNDFIDYFRMATNFYIENEHVMDFKISNFERAFGYDFDTVSITIEKSHDLLSLCENIFIKKSINQIWEEKPENKKIILDLSEKFIQTYNRRNYNINQFILFLKYDMYDECSDFFNKNLNIKHIIMEKCFIKHISKKLNDLKWMQFILQHDFNWSISIYDEKEHLYFENAFHVLFHESFFKNNILDYLKLFEQYKINQIYKHEWNQNNFDGLSMNTICDTMGYNYIFKPKEENHSLVVAEFDENIWSHILAFSHNGNANYHCLIVSNINKDTRNIALQFYKDELKKWFQSKNQCIQCFLFLFCALHYDIEMVVLILLEQFSENLFMDKDDVDYILDCMHSIDKSEKNQMIRCTEATKIICKRKQLFRKIKEEEALCKGFKVEMFDFSKVNFFEFFGVKIDPIFVKYFLKHFAESARSIKKK